MADALDLAVLHRHRSRIDAVSVTNLCFKYERKIPVLNGVNMRVPAGSIYGLLGPSGCGKTTLLRCILNSINFSSGEVFVFGHRLPSSKVNIPGPNVGFMPQEVSLYDDLYVEEFLKYFGKINLLEEPLLTERYNEIIDVLSLHGHTGQIGILSGGQKRRVSFAATLLHRPALVILDEPTVGVDPLLRNRIWNHLLTLSKNHGMTVLITTHYIEEATNADFVGLMRKGKLIAEDSPKTLISSCGVRTLEEVFLHFCYEKTSQFVQEKTKPMIDNAVAFENTAGKSLERKVSTSKYLRDWVKIFAILYWKMHIRYVRHPEVIVFFFVFPVAVVVCGTVCIGRSVFDVHVGLVNYETPENFSLTFIESINTNYMIIEEFETFEEATTAVKSGKIWGFIYIRRDFSESLFSRISFDSEPNESFEDSIITIHADVTSQPTVVSLTRHLEESYRKFLRSLLQLYGYNPLLVALPIRIEEVFYGKQSNDPINPEYIVCGVLILVVYVANCAFVAVVLILERETNMFERHFIAGVTTTQIFVASFAHKLSTICVHTLFLTLIIIMLYDFKWRMSIVWATLILLLEQLSGLSMGLFFSVVFSQVHNLAIVVSAFALFTFCTGGVAWPLASIPYWMRWFSMIQPTCQPAEGFRAAMMKGYGITHFEVWSAMLVSFCYVTICLIAGFKLFRYK